MRIVCQQTILMKCHALFVIFEKNSKIWNCRLLQIIDGALRVNSGKWRSKILFLTIFDLRLLIVLTFSIAAMQL